MLLIVVASSYDSWANDSLVAVDNVSQKTRTVREKKATEQIYKWKDYETVENAIKSFSINESTQMWKSYFDTLVRYGSNKDWMPITMIENDEFTIINPFLKYALEQNKVSDDDKQYILLNNDWGQQVTLKSIMSNKSAVLFNIMEKTYYRSTNNIGKVWSRLVKDKGLSDQGRDCVRQHIQDRIELSSKKSPVHSGTGLGAEGMQGLSKAFPFYGIYSEINNLGRPKHALIDTLVLSFENDNRLIDFVKRIVKSENGLDGSTKEDYDALMKKLKHTVTMVTHTINRILSDRADPSNPIALKSPSDPVDSKNEAADPHRHLESDIPIVTRELKTDSREKVVVIINLITNARKLVSNGRKTYTVLWESLEIYLANTLEKSL